MSERARYNGDRWQSLGRRGKYIRANSGES